MTFHRLFVLASTPTLLAACTMVGAPAPIGPPEAGPAPPPAAEPVSSVMARPAPAADEDPTSSLVTDRVVEIALESIGTPYVWGGTGSNGFDCSGLIQFAYGQVGILLPRISRVQIGSGSPVAPDLHLLRAGDVLGFSDGGTNPYWRGRLVAARRIVG